jgi:hypothetical protein
MGSLNAQITDITKINDALTEYPWLDNSIHEIYGHTIIQVFGERVAEQRHSNLGPITNVAYQSLDQMIAAVDTLQIPEEEKLALKQKYQEEAAGGCVQVFITRPTESRANLKWFFVIIRGADDKGKIMEIDLQYQPSQLPEGNGWWNYNEVFLPVKVDFPFYIYLNDKQSQHLSDFKFKIIK